MVLSTAKYSDLLKAWITFSPSWPGKMRSPLRCVVIGAGVIGASVAARLAASGAQVTLLDQDLPGSAASSWATSSSAASRWSFAWLNSNDKAPRHYHDLNHAGIRAWAELASELDGAAWHR